MTKNIPDEVKKSYLFDKAILSKQDTEFLSGIAGDRIITSKHGNYELYKTKKQNLIISSPNTTFKRTSRVKYLISIKDLKEPQHLFFNDTFHEGWKIYLSPAVREIDCNTPRTIGDLKTAECQTEQKFFEMGDLSFIWEKPLFEDSHSVRNNFSNQWVIDPELIKNNFDNDFYKSNKDGTIDVELVLYFKPQTHFYLGAMITLLVTGGLVIFVIYKRKK